jgi:hypothetical protein
MHGTAKVDQLDRHRILGEDQNILKFDISVYYTFQVAVHHRVQQRPRIWPRHLLCKAAAAIRQHIE